MGMPYRVWHKQDPTPNAPNLTYIPQTPTRKSPIETTSLRPQKHYTQKRKRQRTNYQDLGEVTIVPQNPLDWNSTEPRKVAEQFIVAGLQFRVERIWMDLKNVGEKADYAAGFIYKGKPLHYPIISNPRFFSYRNPRTGEITPMGRKSPPVDMVFDAVLELTNSRGLKSDGILKITYYHGKDTKSCKIKIKRAHGRIAMIPYNVKQTVPETQDSPPQELPPEMYTQPENVAAASALVESTLSQRKIKIKRK